MRTSGKTVNAILRKQVDALFSQTISDLKTREEAEEFLQDFFTKSEKETFGKRLAVAYWLKKGRSYGNIKENLKVSSATIATVQGMLELTGVKNALKKLEADEWANQWTDRFKKLVGK